MPGPRRVPWLRLALVGILVALDLWTKSAVFAWMEGLPAESVQDAHGHVRVPLAGDWLAFMLSRNTGAAWGLLRSFPWVLVVGRVIAVGVLGWLLFRSNRPLMTTALVLVLAGALGNLFDNLALEPPYGHPFGAVRDFIDVYFGVWDYHFPTFNVADSCITCGAAILLLSGFFGKDDEVESEEGTAPERGVAPPAA